MAATQKKMAVTVLPWILLLVLVTATKGVNLAQQSSLRRTYVSYQNSSSCLSLKAAAFVDGCLPTSQVPPELCELPNQQSRAFYAAQLKSQTTTTTTTTTPAPWWQRRRRPPVVVQYRPSQSQNNNGNQNQNNNGNDGSNTGNSRPRRPAAMNAIQDTRGNEGVERDCGCQMERRPERRVIVYNGQDLCCRGSINVCYGYCESWSWVHGEDNILERRIGSCIDTSLQSRWVFFDCTNGCYFWEKVIEVRSCNCRDMQFN